MTCRASVSSLLAFTLYIEEAVQTPVKLIMIGSAAVDISSQADPHTDELLLQSTAPGYVSLSFGGVGRNIAEACHRVLTSFSQDLASATLLIAAIGNDTFGRLLVDETRKLGMRTNGLIQGKQRTAVCNMILDSRGSLVGGIADMSITEALDGETVLQPATNHKPSIICLDGNLSPQVIRHVVKYCNERRINIFFEPTSVIKATAIFPSVQDSIDSFGPTHVPITFASPNLLELSRMHQAAQEHPLNLMAHPAWRILIDNFSLGDNFRMDLEQLARQNVSDHDVSKGTLRFLVDQGIVQKAIDLLPFFQHLVIKCGDLGILVAMRFSPGLGMKAGWTSERSNRRNRFVVARGKANEIVVLQHFPPLAVENIVNVTGAGDSFVGALLAFLVERPHSFHSPKSLEDIISNAQRAAILTLQSHVAVSPLLSESRTRLNI